MIQKNVQFCPRCASTNIQLSNVLKLGNPFATQTAIGWDCLTCGYTGKDFLITSEEEYKRILKKNKSGK